MAEPSPAISVGVVAICGPDHLRRCLSALRFQEGVADFEVVVAYDPALRGMDEVAADYPYVRMVANQGQRTPLELASRAIRETTGEIVLLTEDHCIPHRDWVAKLAAALQPGYAAAGGVVELSAGATATDFAFYFVDFFRYAEPVSDGPSPTLTVCNVAYRRGDLEQLAEPPWKVFFHETAVNSALRARFGPLRLCRQGRVTMRRHVTLRDAIRERYVFGRLFGSTRLAGATPRMRAAYKLLAPALPPLLLGRMLGKAARSSELRKQVVRAFLPLQLMVLSWSVGEWLGYLTGTRPRVLTVAKEIEG